MAYHPNDPHRAGRSEEEMRRRDNELQADPQLVEGPASGTKVAMYAIAIAVVLGVVFYGLNNNSVDQAGTAPPSETAQQTRPANPAGPSGKTTNTEPGTTTGAATTNRPTPPSPNPTGTEVDRSKQ
jgi:type IV secretory pathway VirB10-like protein